MEDPFPPAEPGRPRRVRVSNRRGIYYRIGQDGRRRYEISYTDSDGRRRWKTVGTRVTDAQDALDELRSRMRRGERVAPTKETFAEVAERWLAAQTKLRPQTMASYRWALDKHVLPAFGRLRIVDVDENDIAKLMTDLRARDYSAWSCRAILTPVGRVLKNAVRRGLIPANPLGRLERGERPSVERGEMRILQEAEIGRVLDAAGPRLRPLFTTAIFTGLRVGELLGLRWADIDFERGLVHVRRQMDRFGNSTKPKTDEAIRGVVFPPSLGRVLKAHRFASLHSGPGDLVFGSQTGRPPNRSTVGRGLHRAVAAAGLDANQERRLRFHDLRHTFASMQIGQGADVVFVSRQLGHKNPNITLGVYSHLFDHERHADAMRAQLEARFGELIDANGTDRPAQPAEVVDIARSRPQGNPA